MLLARWSCAVRSAAKAFNHHRNAPPCGAADLAKHGYLLALAKWVKLYSRPGNDLTKRFPLIVDAIARLTSRSCTIEKH
jgi:hypothetical protein